jgi:hypothetical protein
MSQMGQSLPVQALRATSGLPPLATELRTSRDVSNVPATDSCTAAIGNLLDQLVGAQDEVRRDLEADFLCGYQIDDKLELARLFKWGYRQCLSRAIF